MYSDSPKDVIGATRLAELFDLVSITVLPMVSGRQTIPYAFGAPVPLELVYSFTCFYAADAGLPRSAHRNGYPNAGRRPAAVYLPACAGTLLPHSETAKDAVVISVPQAYLRPHQVLPD